MKVLNIPVSPQLLARWAEWLAPPVQPFFLTEAETLALGLPSHPSADGLPTPELSDTFTVWNLSAAANRTALLSEAEWNALEQFSELHHRKKRLSVAPFSVLLNEIHSLRSVIIMTNALSASARQTLVRLQVRYGRGNVPHARAFADLRPELRPGRFVWWPSMLTPEVVARAVAAESVACQREQVPEAVWQAAAGMWPGARALAGTFAPGSGPNCFGTVMAAAGISGAEQVWMQRGPFESFLATRTRLGGQDDHPGTLLVWRSRGGQLEHAALVLGGGWALHTPAQSWITPRVVLPTRALIRAYRTPGHRLERRALN